MGKTVCERADNKRELLYSFTTVVFNSLFCYWTVTSAFSTGSGTLPVLEKESEDVLKETVTVSSKEDGGDGDGTESVPNSTIDGGIHIQDYIVQRRELPFEILLYVVLLEMVKLLITFTIYPGSHFFATPGLPLSRRDRENVATKSPSFQVKVVELLKGLYNYIGACATCLLFVILLGAPVVSKLTFQFSVILTTWLFCPMALAIQPSRMLQEVLFISSWSSESQNLHRTKLRFATTVFGAWMGAIVVPLDWDRPWQAWPIPCLVSTTLAFLISNLVLTFHLFCTIFDIKMSSIMDPIRAKIKAV